MKRHGLILLFLSLVACHSQPKKAKQSDTTQNQLLLSGDFDLARLRLTEKVSSFLASGVIKDEPKDASETTVFGYEVFKSSSPKLLQFESTAFSGPNNHVLLHYDDKKKKLAGYEVLLYNQAQTDTLIKLMGKAGKLVFKLTTLPKGSYEIDENGRELKPEKSERQTFRVWENKSNGLTYYLIEKGSGRTLTTHLIALKNSTEFSKTFISSSSLDFYKNAESEPL